jgi:hypothetical protein
MIRRHRFAILVGSLLFLAVSIVVFRGYRRESLEMTPEQVRALRQASADYALRLRTDGFSLLDKGEYEMALARFDEAAEWDPQTDRHSPYIRGARRQIAESIGIGDSPSRTDAAPPVPPTPSEARP